MKKTLFLGSQSSSRQMLLTQAEIHFTLLPQSADETVCDWGLPLEEVVKNIALHKMNHLIMPTGKRNQCVYVLTADTLSVDRSGRLSGKPKDRAEAVMMIKRARNGMRTATAFCLEKKEWDGVKWLSTEQVLEYVDARYIFNVPDQRIDEYFNSSTGFSSSGAIAIEGYGGQFLKEINGSYSAIVGLPLFEVRTALEVIGFFN